MGFENRMYILTGARGLQYCVFDCFFNVRLYTQRTRIHVHVRVSWCDILKIYKFALVVNIIKKKKRLCPSRRGQTEGNPTLLDPVTGLRSGFEVR